MTRFMLGIEGLLLLTGCSLPGSMIGMNKEQIEAMAKIKDAGAVCVTATVNLQGNGRMIFAAIDKGIKGKVTVATDCTTTIETK